MPAILWSAADYETVLCGRMHFVGLDQRHGFEKRIAKDITVTHWAYVFNGSGRLGKSRRETEAMLREASRRPNAAYYGSPRAISASPRLRNQSFAID